MRPPPHSDKHPRFHAPVRHYHRAGVKGPDEWDTWVEGSKKPDKKGKFPRVLIMVLSTLLVAAVIAIVWMALSAN